MDRQTDGIAVASTALAMRALRRAVKRYSFISMLLSQSGIQQSMVVECMCGRRPNCCALLYNYTVVLLSARRRVATVRPLTHVRRPQSCTIQDKFCIWFDSVLDTYECVDWTVGCVKAKFHYAILLDSRSATSSRAGRELDSVMEFGLNWLTSDDRDHLQRFVAANANELDEQLESPHSRSHRPL